MKDVKFQGIRVDNNEWVCGFLVQWDSPFDHQIIKPVQDTGTEFESHRIIRGSERRYTGLKDKNGEEIYEKTKVKYTQIHYTDCGQTEIERIEEPIVGTIYYAEGLWLGIKKEDGTGIIFFPGTFIANEHNPELEVVEVE